MQLLTSRRRHSRGFSLLVVLMLTAVALLILAGLLDWVGATGNQTARTEERYGSLSAAEAATEKVIAAMTLDFLAAAERSDFQGADLTPLDSNLFTYEGQFPSTELADVANYEFTGPTLGVDTTYVSKISDRAWTNLAWKYEGFGGQAASFRVVSNARNTDSGRDIVTALRQDVQFASIPIFEYGIFFGSGMDLEVNPAHESYTNAGPVHGNANIYTEPHTFTVVFGDAVTACGIITNAASPLDTTIRTPGPVVFQKGKDRGVAPLHLPIGMDNTPANLHKLIEIPTGTEPALLSQNQYYNKADLIIRVMTNDIVRYIVGGIQYEEPITNMWQYGTNVLVIGDPITFFNRRESGSGFDPWVKFIEIDVERIPDLMARFGLSQVPTNIYVADLRLPPIGHQPGIRLVNADDLSAFSAAGLTIATPNPLYVKGDFNSVSPRPASLVCDAIHILSAGWNDAGSTNSCPPASADLTINAGILTGIVPSNGTAYSGGVDNVFRLIEDWTGRQLNFTGSIVVLFESQIATGPWVQPPAYYQPPNRSFSYDVNFKNPAALPPGTPHVRTVIRQERAITQANSTL